MKANAYQTVLQSMKREALAKRELSKTVLRGCCMLVFGTLHEKCRHWNEAEKISDKQIVEISVLLAKYRKEIASVRHSPHLRATVLIDAARSICFKYIRRSPSGGRGFLQGRICILAGEARDSHVAQKMLDDVLWFLAVGWQKEEQSW